MASGSFSNAVTPSPATAPPSGDRSLALALLGPVSARPADGPSSARAVAAANCSWAAAIRRTLTPALCDLDLEGSNSANAFYAASSVYPYQITMFNILSNGNQKSFYDYNASQMALVQFVMNGMGMIQGIYINNWKTSARMAATPITAVDPGTSMTSIIRRCSAVPSMAAVLPITAMASKRFCISACRMCVIENNLFENANKVGAVLKLHNGNPNSGGSWVGQYTELVEISDNLFTGVSGAQLVEIAPQILSPTSACATSCSSAT